MTARPMPFSAPMVRALLDCRKTQTRRVLKLPKWAAVPPEFEEDEDGGISIICEQTGCFARLPNVARPGDRLWVRESYYQQGHWWEDQGDLTKKGKPKWKFAPYSHDITFDEPRTYLKARCRKDPAVIRWYKRMARFMPRRYSRLTLTVTEVRVQRLQDISEADAIAEGVERLNGDGPNFYTVTPRIAGPVQWHHSYPTAAECYRDLWNSLHGPDAWDANPWVVARTFDVRKGNIDDPR